MLRTITSLVLVTLICFCQTPTGNDPEPNTQEPRADNGGLRIISPNGGETFKVGDEITIEFDYVESEYDEVFDVSGILDLYMWPDSARPLVGSIQGNQITVVTETQRVWTIPETIIVNGQTVPFPTGSSFKIYFRDYNSFYEKDDFSDGFFSIMP